MYELTYQGSVKGHLGVGKTNIFNTLRISVDKHELGSNILVIEKRCRELETLIKFPLRKLSFSGDDVLIEFDLTSIPVQLYSMDQFNVYWSIADKACNIVFPNISYFPWTIYILAMNEDDDDGISDEVDDWVNLESAKLQSDMKLETADEDEHMCFHFNAE